MAHATSVSSALTVDDENSLFVETPLSGPRQPRSIIGSLLYCILLAGYAVVAAAAPWIFFLIPKLIPALLCSFNAILLVITGIFQEYLVYQVKKLRLQGYYMLSEKLKHIARLPFATIAYGTDLMLLILVWQPHLHILSVSTLLRLSMFAEVIGAGFFMSVYIGCIHQYNSLNGQPDILTLHYTALQPSSSVEDLRYEDNECFSDQQIALLQYQNGNVLYLNKEVLRLQELLSKCQYAADRNAQMMNQVHSELRLTRILIIEKDREIYQTQLTNRKSAEEYERLREELNKWSSRATELERALMAEPQKSHQSSSEDGDTWISKIIFQD